MIKKIFLLILSVLLLFFLAEIYFRLFNPQQTVDTMRSAGFFPCYSQGEYYWAKLKPEAECILHSNFGDFPDLTIKTNSLGLRDKEIASKSANLKRILFIGDSFTFGWGVKEEQSFSRLTEQMLQSDGFKVETINAGKPNSAPDYYYLYLKNEGIKLDPDIVVIGFDMVQDIYNIGFNTTWEKTDKQDLPLKVSNKLAYIDSSGVQKWKFIPFRLKVPLLNSSHLFAYLMDLIFPARLDLIRNPLDIQQEAENKIKKMFISMNDSLKKENRNMVILMIPLKLNINDPSTINSEIYYFEDFFQKNNIDYINLLSFFIKHQDKNEIYYKNDGHFTLLGHQLAAQELYSKIKILFNQNH